MFSHYSNQDNLGKTDGGLSGILRNSAELVEKAVDQQLGCVQPYSAPDSSATQGHAPKHLMRRAPGFDSVEKISRYKTRLNLDLESLQPSDFSVFSNTHTIIVKIRPKAPDSRKYQYELSDQGFNSDDIIGHVSANFSNGHLTILVHYQSVMLSEVPVTLEV